MAAFAARQKASHALRDVIFVANNGRLFLTGWKGYLQDMSKSVCMFRQILNNYVTFELRRVFEA